MGKTLEAICTEQHMWAQRNFGEVPAWQPLLGVVEELGEYLSSRNDAEERDAIGDIQIYLMDYVRRRGWNLPELIAAARSSSAEGAVTVGLPIILGELARAQLKEAQGIRGDASAHQNAAKLACGHIMLWLHNAAEGRGWDAHEILQETWEKVSRRNWRSNALTGGA